MFTRKVKKIGKKQLKVNNTKIPLSDGVKYLGVFLDKRLSFNKHITDKITKCKKHLHALNNIIGKKWGPAPKLMKWAYTGIVRPKLTYACHLWSHKMSKSMKDQLTRMQRLGCLTIAKAHRSTPTAGLEIIYNIPPIDLHLEKTACLTWARLNDHIDSCWSGIGTTTNSKGHWRALQEKCNQINYILVPRDKITKTPNWNRKFNIREIVKYQNETTENPNSIECYTDGSGFEG